MTGPKLPVQDKNQFNPQSTKVQFDAVMAGPVYGGGTAKNQYNIIEGVKVRTSYYI